MKETKIKFNYVIGHYWKDDVGSVGAYNHFGEVHFGPMEEAMMMLEYVQNKSPDYKWKIFQLVSVPT
jgi:hypothetical protein